MKQSLQKSSNKFNKLAENCTILLSAMSFPNPFRTYLLQDYHTAGRGRPPVDASQDFTLVKGTEHGGYTELWFKRKADTGDSGKDLPITVSCNYLKLNFYAGPSKGSFHVMYIKIVDLGRWILIKDELIVNIELDL